MRRLILSLAIAAFATWAGIGIADAQSTSDPMVCMKTCMDT